MHVTEYKNSEGCIFSALLLNAADILQNMQLFCFLLNEQVEREKLEKGTNACNSLPLTLFDSY